jgi:3-oxoacyl-[acyl-carrier protein] reductase
MHSDPSTLPLHGKTAVVTGGSSGIGAAVVQLLAAQGARVVIGFNQGADRAEALRAALPGTGHLAIHLPLGDTSVHAAVTSQLASLVGSVDMLVNSAGYTSRIPHTDLATLDSALFNEILLTNAGGTFSITRALMPLLQKSGDATVVSVSSISAFTGSGSNIAYCAAKAALDTMTLSLARVFGPTVRFLCVSPASVDTGFVPGRTPEDVQKKSAATPLGRAVTPEDVALAVLACVTHLRTATGTRIIIDGGQHL